MATRIDRAVSALIAARRVIRDERKVTLECGCLADKRGRPRLETLDELAKPHVARFDRALKKLDRALADWGL